jgi:PHD/YefM family antitoxin component YafN of YafNO toxin-antitoxin module
MISLHEDYVVDEHGKRKAVVVPMAEWKQILEALEELDDIRAYDNAKAYPSDAVPLDQAVAELREGEDE